MMKSKNITIILVCVVIILLLLKIPVVYDFIFNIVNWVAISGILMALFAYFSWKTAKETNKNQKELLEYQTKIQRKHYLLYKSYSLKELLDVIEELIFQISVDNYKEPDFNFKLMVVEAKTKLIFPDNTAIKKLGEIIDDIKKDKNNRKSKDTIEPLLSIYYGLEEGLGNIGRELRD
jgi:hypothetical protein